MPAVLAFSKNIALVVFSLVVALIVETILWVPWSMKTRVKTAIVHGRARRSPGVMVQ
jgi:hypothetical protein